MGVYERLKSFVERLSVDQLPADIYAALIDDVFLPLLSFAVGATIPPLIGGIAAWRSGSVWLAALSIGAAVLTGARILLTWQYREQRTTIAGSVAALRHWDRLYELFSAAYAACIGALSFGVFVFIQDPVSELLLDATAFAYTAGATARNSSRPRVAVLQLTLIMLPIAIGCALRQNLAYAALSVITLLYYLAALEIVQTSGEGRLSLLLAMRDRVALVHSLAEQNVLFDTALNNMAQGLCMFDSTNRLLIANRRFSEIFRIPTDKLAPGTHILEIMGLAQVVDTNPVAAAAKQQKLLSEITAGPLITTLLDGRTISIAHRPMPSGGLVATFDDVSEQRRAEERAQFLSTHDELTGLPNRLMFGQTVAEAVNVGRRYGQEFAIMFLDLDRFKIINDTLGHSAGDYLLVEVAKRLKECVRESDMVARLGGDEFVVLLREMSDAQQITTVARKILAAIVKPLTIHGRECRVTGSIGISLFPSDAQDEESLTKNADAAMYAAKEEGRNNFLFHSPEIRSQSIERLMLEASLQRAVERNELVLYYQPKRDLQRGGISGVEALLRWNHPDLGLLQPNRFISLAEETGLIVPIGKWVLQTACAQNMAWQRQGLPPLRIAVNLSARQFADPNLLTDIRNALETSGMPPRLLELEITESMVMQNLERTIRVLEAIKHLGVILSVDDFGTGYSSMSLIKKLPIDALKIDRSFIREIASDADDRAITEAIIALGQALNLTVVAEGVETIEQETILRANHCDEIQGYLISKPVPADEFAAFVASDMLAELKAHATKAAGPAKVGQQSDDLPTGTRG